MGNKHTAFIPDELNTPNPAWTKEKIKGNDIGAQIRSLAEHICRRTPPNSYTSGTAVFINIVNRNDSALGYWDMGYKWLTTDVINLLNKRDGTNLEGF